MSATTVEDQHSAAQYSAALRSAGQGGNAYLVDVGGEDGVGAGDHHARIRGVPQAVIRRGWEARQRQDLQRKQVATLFSGFFPCLCPEPVLVN